jgi:glycosyltransferase involved in cell wall biosynthesis
MSAEDESSPPSVEQTVESDAQWMGQVIEPPRVSVVTIFRDAERFLDEAVASVFAQTYADWELLLVDDGSTDSSSAHARGWAAQHPHRVRYLEHPAHANLGMSASRNLGIRHARGVHLAFLDADDVWLPPKLDEQVPLLEAWPEATMVYGLSQWWYSWTGRPEDQGRDFVHPLGVAPNMLAQPPELIHRFFLRQDAAIPSPSSILVRRSTVEKVGGFEETFRGLYEDQVFYSKVCLAGSVFASNRCWDRYRQHPDSSVSAANRAGRAYEARLTFLNWLEAYLAVHAAGHHHRIRRALEEEIRRCTHPLLYGLKAAARRTGLRGSALAWYVARRGIPAPVRELIGSRLMQREYRPPPGWVRLGHLRTVTPINRQFGFGRGLPVDRYYIERFLATHAADICGRVLEIGDDTYARRFGGSQVTRVDVLHVTGGEPGVTIVADLTAAAEIPSATFDCVILTQTLQFVYDVPAAIATVERILRPGGVVLATVPGISQISRYDMDHFGQFWSFTTVSVRRLFATSFPTTAIRVEAYGNVLAAVALLHGLAYQEIGTTALNQGDRDYQVTIAVRAVKP